jgi:hypothetical protein
MDDNRETTVTVKRQWNDHRRATFRIDDLDGLHWATVSGGVKAVAPQPFVHAYVQCDDKIDGELAHSAAHGPCPHRIKVCLTKVDNQDVWNEVLRRAGPKPRRGIDPSHEKKKLFRDRGFSRATVTALIAAGIDAPERLLFLDFEKEKLKGIGPVKFQEIEAYRTRFLPNPQGSTVEE